jgi:16S rRNA (guanine1207-N2)-methyltransferase
MSPDAPGSHYFSDHTGSDAPRSKPRTLQFRVDGRELEVSSDSGVFSHGHIDEGTALLIGRGARLDEGQRYLLDLGCGWGALAVALALRAPDATVVAVDVNPRAVELTGDNARRLELDNIVAVRVGADPPLHGLDDALAGTGAPRLARATAGASGNPPLFDAVWSNPPVRIGKKAMHALLLAAVARVRPGGSMHLVVHRHLGSDSLQRWLGDQGFPTTRRLSRSGFRLLDVLIPGDPPPTPPDARLAP